jgi:hypothetical protein
VRVSDAEQQQLAELMAGEAGVPRVQQVQAGEAKPHVAWQENKAGQRMAERATGKVKFQQVRAGQAKLYVTGRATG